MYLRTTLFSSVGDDGSIPFLGNIPQGYKVRLTIVDRNSILDGVAQLQLKLRKKRFPTGKKPSIAICFSCTVRRAILGLRTDEECSIVRSALGADIPVFGFYTYGEFSPPGEHPGAAEIWRTVMTNWRLVILGMMLSITTTVTFYLITAYMPTYGSSVLHLTAKSSMLVTLCVGISNLCFLPISGALSDRVGRRPLLLLFSTIALVTPYPVLLWLVSAPVVRTPAGRGLVVLHDLRQLQRSHGGLPHRSDAGQRARLRLLLRLQPGHRNLRRLHAGDFHVSDPHHRRSRHARPVAFLRRT